MLRRFTSAILDSTNIDVVDATFGDTEPRALRFVTYLAAPAGVPGLPLRMFSAIARHIGGALRRPAQLQPGTCGSGPLCADDDPFARGEADVAFVCAPSMLWLVAHGTARLLDAAPLLDDPRAEGRPIYFCEVVVRRDHPAARFEDLRGATAAYNDVASLSGYRSLLRRLQPLGGPTFLGQLVATGSHAASVHAVASGDADLAVIDANVWRSMGREADRLRVVETLGPYPVQPLIVRADLEPDVAQRITAALLGMRGVPDTPLRGFAPISLADYACLALEEPALGNTR